MFQNTKFDVTSSRLEFLGDEFEGLAKNKSINHIATQFINHRARIQAIYNDTSRTDDANTIRTFKEIERVRVSSGNDFKNLNDSLALAFTKQQELLFSSTSKITTIQGNLLAAMLEKYNGAKVDDRLMMIDNEATAHLIIELGRNGFIDGVMIKAINEKYSPDVVSEIEAIKKDVDVASSIEKEFALFNDINSDPAANKLISKQVD